VKDLFGKDIDIPDRALTPAERKKLFRKAPKRAQRRGLPTSPARKGNLQGLPARLRKWERFPKGAL